MKRALIGLLVAALAASCGFPVSGQAPPAAPLAPDALAEWLTVLSLLNLRAARLSPQASTKLLNIFPRVSRTPVCGLEETMVRIFRMSAELV